MTYVIAQDVTDIASGNQDTNHRPEQIEVVGSISKRIGEPMLELVDQEFEDERSRST